MDKKVVVIGVPVDTNIDEESLEVKRMAICKTLPSLSDSISKTGYSLLSQRFSSKKFILRGNVNVPEWLLPLPPVETFPLLNPIARIEFIKKDGLRAITEKVEEVVFSLGDEVPFLISEEHCMSYGSFKALKRKGKNPLFLCFDSHIDIISISSRLGRKEENYFSSANFILKMVEDKILEPGDVFIIGSSEKFLKGSPPYKELSGLRKRGLKIMDKSHILRGYVPEIPDGYKEIYISIDTDVCAGERTCAVRTRNFTGIPPSIFLTFFKNLVKKFKNKEIVGMDLCEIDVLVADSSEDETLNFWVEVIKILIDEAL